MIARPHLPPKTVYVCPRDIDVKCGRGSHCFNHHGNELLRIRVAMKLDDYCKQAKRSLKTKIIDCLIVDFFAEGARFLKLDRVTGMWFDGGIKAAKERIGSAFRDASQPNKVKCMQKLKEHISAKDQSGDLRKFFMTANGKSCGADRSRPAVPSTASKTDDKDRTYGTIVKQIGSTGTNAVHTRTPITFSTKGHVNHGGYATICLDDEHSLWQPFLRDAEERWSFTEIEDLDDINEGFIENYVGDPQHFTPPEKEFLAALDWTKLASCIV